MSHATPSFRNLSVATAVFLAAFVGCGGDEEGPQNPGGGSTNSPHGHAVDSALQGVEYTSGAKTGFTESDGKFFFEKNTDVSFKIGDIALGSGAPAAVMSPLNLVLGATSVTNPTVTNLARFLQTCDDDGNPGNGIVITSAVRAAAMGQSVDFEQDPTAFGNDANVQSVISALTSATAAGERALVGATEAQTQLTNGVREAYVGNNNDYNGDFCVNQQSGQTRGGTWAMEVDANGVVSIGFNGTPSFIATGTMDLLGNVIASAPGGVSVYGTFEEEFNGVWYAGETSGSFSESADCSH